MFATVLLSAYIELFYRWTDLDRIVLKQKKNSLRIGWGRGRDLASFSEEYKYMPAYFD
jgi:hypothetical protein